ncbi:MAG: ATP-binding protein [Pirellulaceae bacterium]|nr:ATP-binding protein [Pirellulaceae bacterium]
MEKTNLSRAAINLSWLITLRWAAVTGQLVTISTVYFGLGIEIPVTVLMGTSIAIGATNALFALCFHYFPRELTNPQTSAQLCKVITFGDVAFLTLLLYWSGGLTNPFHVFYFVNLALAAVLLPIFWGWGLVVFSLACALFLSYFYIDLPLSPTQRNSPLFTQTGTLFAFLSCSPVIVYFITRITRQLRNKELELKRIALRQAESEKWEALGTLSAGVAHELANPLATIAVVTNELEIQAKKTPEEVSHLLDIQLIRQEVDKCRTILERMTRSTDVNPLELITAEKIVLETIADLDQSRLISTYQPHSKNQVIQANRIHLTQALRCLVQNALEASPATSPVELEISQENEYLLFYISDLGKGIPEQALAKIGNPFFTTKDPGQGMGLGVYIARTVIRRLGGDLYFTPNTPHGTRVCVSLPFYQKNQKNRS